MKYTMMTYVHYKYRACFEHKHAELKKIITEGSKRVHMKLHMQIILQKFSKFYFWLEIEGLLTQLISYYSFF